MILVEGANEEEVEYLEGDGCLWDDLFVCYYFRFNENLFSLLNVVELDTYILES